MTDERAHYFFGMVKKLRHHDRNAALDEALAVFWRQGYHATSMKDLEAALSMHPGSIYAAFESKEQLFVRSLERYGERMAAERAAALAGARSPLAGLATYVRRVHPIARDDLPARACMLAKTAFETGWGPGPVRAALDRLLARTEDGLIEVFRAAQAAGELAPDADPVRLAQRLHVELMGLGVYAQRPERGAATVALAEAIAREIEALRMAPAAVH